MNPFAIVLRLVFTVAIFAHAVRLRREKEQMLPLIRRFTSYSKAAEALAKKKGGM